MGTSPVWRPGSKRVGEAPPAQERHGPDICQLCLRLHAGQSPALEHETADRRAPQFDRQRAADRPAADNQDVYVAGPIAHLDQADAALSGRCQRRRPAPLGVLSADLCRRISDLKYYLSEGGAIVEDAMGVLDLAQIELLVNNGS